MNSNLNGKQIKQGTVKIDRLDNQTSGQYTLFDTGIMLGLTDGPVLDTDLVNKEYADNLIGSQYSGSINITAAGTDTYLCISSPAVTSFETDIIYIVEFENNNTSTTPTLVGVTIVKTDQTGIIPLDPDDIISGIQYFLTYNGVELQLYLTSPAGAPGTYTNLNPVPVTQGGIPAGTIFNNNTISSVFDMLLYPYQSANFTSFAISGQSTLIEVGATILAGSKTFTWGTTNSAYVTPNSIEISKLTGGTVILGSGLANTGSTAITIAAITNTTPATYTWQIKGTRTNSTNFTSNLIVTWAYKMFTGTSSNATLTGPQAYALTGVLKTSSITGTYAFGSGDYKYFVIPNNLPNPTSFKDAATNLTVGMADATDGYTDTNAGSYSFKLLSVTNVFGVVQTYRVYRTKYTLGGSINIEVL